MRPDERARSIKVGLFLLASVVIIGAAVFILGRSEALFARKVQLHTSFVNTSGLIVGAPVRLGGLDVGIVQRIAFDKDPREKKVHVTLAVDSAFLVRIRSDSVARLGGKGLLGDMIINISVGNAEAPELHDGDTLKSEETEGLTEIVQSVHEAVDNVKVLAADVDSRLKMVLTEDLAKDVGRVAHSAANVVEKVEKGNGLVHAVVYDARLGEKVGDVLDGADRIVRDADHAVARVDRLLAAVEQGNGTAHALIYGEDGAKALGEVRRAAAELAQVIDEVKNGKGLVHSLVYEEDRGNLLSNLTRMSEVLRRLADETEQGKGTVGALLKDPTIYEDLKDLLGNVRRNKLLKALIRYEIDADGMTKPEKP